MGAFEDFKDLLNHLQWEFDALSDELSSMKNESQAAFQEVAEACREANRLVRDQVDRLEVESLVSQFETFQTSIKSSPLCVKIPELGQRIGLLLEKEARLRRTQREIRKKLRVLEKEIDAWIATMKKRPTKHRKVGVGAVTPVASLETSLDSLDSSFSKIRADMESSGKCLEKIQRDFPQVILALLDAINKWIQAFEDSIHALRSSVELLTSTELFLPKDVYDWRSQLVGGLQEREVHLHPNLQLGTSDLNLFATNLFQTELTQREQAALIIPKEQESVQKLVDIHLPELGISHFDIVEFERNKIIDGKSRSLARFIKDRQKTTWSELKLKHKKQWDEADFCPQSKFKVVKESTPRTANSTKVKQLLEGYQAQFAQQVDTIVALQLHEENNEKIQSSFQSLLGEAPSKLQRHFKDKPFSVLVLASTKMDLKEFVSAYKRSWHLYPNFHLCTDALLTSKLKQRELDEIIKLPISAKLCTACLQGVLTSDQALVLQSIDVHNELFEFVMNHRVDLSLVFALHAQEGQLWLGALLNNPEMFSEIEQHRHDPFEQSIWDLVVQEKVKLWQYACIVRLDFEDSSTKETLLLADDFWTELNEMAALYEVEDALQELIKIYKPVKDTANPGAQISLNDVYNTIKPIASVTVNKSGSKSKKTKRRKKGRYQI